MSSYRTIIQRSALSAAIALAIGVNAGPANADVQFERSNFTMLSPGPGQLVGGMNDVYGSWDETLNTSENSTNFNMTLGTATQFFVPPPNGIWHAHHIRVYGPGNYTFDSGCTTDQLDAGIHPCGAGGTFAGNPISMTVDPDQIGGHMLFNWNCSTNIDVVNVWDREALYDGGAPNARLAFFDAVPPLQFFLDQVPDVYPTVEDAYAALFAAADGVKNTIWYGASTDDNGSGVPSVGMVDGPFGGFNGNFNLRRALNATVKAEPQSVNVNSQGSSFTMRIELRDQDGSPVDSTAIAEGVKIVSVRGSNVARNWDNEIGGANSITETVADRAFADADNNGVVELAAAFNDPATGNRQNIIALLSDLPDKSNALVCVAGDATDSGGTVRPFRACDTIKVNNKGNR